MQSEQERHDEDIPAAQDQPEPGDALSAQPEDAGEDLDELEDGSGLDEPEAGADAAEDVGADELSPASLSRREKGALLTALLFTATETLDSDKAADYLGLSMAELAVLVEEQSGELRNLGLDILPLGGGYKLVTASHWDAWLSLFHRQVRKARLSKSALEILAVIAYEQPISRVRVDELRQANSEAAVRTLLDRRLIKVAGRAETPGRPFLYKTTETFLEVFGLTSLGDLPPRPQSFKAEAEEAEAKLQSEEGTGDLHVRGEAED
ncbi:SMC-Scp complex subunit ScpB [bacterium]|nr:SMC-Scp complex subunit ScpB [bacterium]